MILAGIDEAGYGPLLGPLVVGCAAFELASTVPVPEDGAPDLWALLGKLVARTRSRSGKKIHVNDSKQVYSASAGLKELERSILSLCATCHDMPSGLDELVERVAPQARVDLADQRWYGTWDGEKFPADNDATSVRLFGNGLRAEMKRTGCSLVHLAARVVPEKRLNQIMHATRNKASASFTMVATHIDELMTKFADHDLLVYCDRQGGRAHYGSLLRLMFEDWQLEVSAESAQTSRYALTRDRRRVRIVFTEKAEVQCMSVAVASLLCKYLREMTMARFNAWWISHDPALRPTAGYYTDGRRFLNDVSRLRAELGVPDDELIRCR